MSARRRIPALLTLGAATLGLAAGTASAAGTTRTTSSVKSHAAAQRPAQASTGQTAGAPSTLAISDLPSILTSSQTNDGVAITFPSSPSTTTLRAAITAASAFSGLTGHGVTFETFLHPTPAELKSAPVSVIEMDPRPGPATISLSKLSAGNVLVKLSGEGQPLITAAKLLSTKWIAALGRSSTTVAGSLTAAVDHLTPSGGNESLRSGSVSTGSDQPLTISRTINIPVDKVIDEAQALLRLGVEYDAPGGGRLTFKLNGHVIGASESRGKGNSFDYRFRVASVWTDGPNLQPAYYLNVGRNVITITATAANKKLAAQVGTELALTPDSDIQMKLAARRPQQQLELWPFPLYTGTWAHTTVVTRPAADLNQSALSALISALANTERLTGVPADPQISYTAPTAAQKRGNLLVFGDPETVAQIKSVEPAVPGMISEQTLSHGGTALLITDTRGLDALGAVYYPGLINGQTVVIDDKDKVHTIVKATPPQAFATPKIPWLKPAAGIAAVLLLWVAFRVFLARRRLRSRPDMPAGGVLS